MEHDVLPNQFYHQKTTVQWMYFKENPAATVCPLKRASKVTAEQEEQEVIGGDDDTAGCPWLAPPACARNGSRNGRRNGCVESGSVQSSRGGVGPLRDTIERRSRRCRGRPSQPRRAGQTRHSFPHGASMKHLAPCRSHRGRTGHFSPETVRARGTEEVTQRCLIHLRVISLAAQTTTGDVSELNARCAGVFGKPPRGRWANDPNVRTRPSCPN